MLVTKEVDVKITKRNFQHFLEKGYNCELGQIITVKTTDLQEHCDIKVIYKCNGCDTPHELRYEDYFKKRKRPYAKWGDFCEKCNKGVRAKWYKEHDPEGYEETNQKRLEKLQETCKEKYGVDNPMKVPEFKENFKESFQEKYGVDNPMKVPEIRKKLNEKMQDSEEIVIIKKANGAVFHQIHGVPVSKNQRYFWELYGGELNKSLDPGYIVDVYLGDNIYFEYDGSGHNLTVQLGQLTEKEFENKEIKRYKGLKYHGYKQFVFVSKHQKQRLPSDEVLLKIKEVALDYLSKDGHNWIKFDYDNKLIKTKQGSYPYDYIDPQQIPQL